jgi:hypothetical protein
MKTRLLHRSALLALLALAAPPAARAQAPAVRDTSLGRFLDGLSDSTDRYFGVSAAPVDTAGLDTVLSDSAVRPKHRLALGILPSYGFSRVDGSTPGAALSIGDAIDDPGHTGWGRLQGGIARALGPDVTLGGAHYTNRLWLARQPFDLDLWGGRRTSPMDGDDSGRLLTLARALLWGSDWAAYYRTDGFTAALDHPHGWWRAGAGFLDALQSPLRTTATWNLLKRPLGRPGNLAATRGRATEVSAVAAAHWPGLPLRTEVEVRNASRSLGGDFEYQRVRAAAGLDLSLGRFASLVPQFAYGRLSGDALPQASFYLGADGSLRSLHRNETAGTRMAIARVELIGVRDVLELLRLPHPSALPLQAALFASSGAQWGLDPFTGTLRSTGDWPDRREWLSEAGASLVYRSPIFPQGAALSLSHAWPIGPGAGAERWSVSFTRPFDLMGPDPTPIEEQ